MKKNKFKLKKPNKYFFTPKEMGVNADLERHKKEEKYLKGKIKEAEESDDKFSERFASTYKRLLDQLMTSKMFVACKIGKNKK